MIQSFSLLWSWLERSVPNGKATLPTEENLIVSLSQWCLPVNVNRVQITPLSGFCSVHFHLRIFPLDKLSFLLEIASTCVWRNLLREVLLSSLPMKLFFDFCWSNWIVVQLTSVVFVHSTSCLHISHWVSLFKHFSIDKDSSLDENKISNL